MAGAPPMADLPPLPPDPGLGGSPGDPGKDPYGADGMGADPMGPPGGGFGASPPAGAGGDPYGALPPANDRQLLSPARRLALTGTRAYISFLLTLLATLALLVSGLSAPFVADPMLSFVTIRLPRRPLVITVGLFGSCMTDTHRKLVQCTDPWFGGFTIESFGVDEPGLANALSSSQTYWLFLPALCLLVCAIAVLAENTHLLLFTCLLGAMLLTWATVAVEVAIFNGAVLNVRKMTKLQADLGVAFYISCASSLIITIACALSFETHVWQSCRPSKVEYGDDDGRSEAGDEPSPPNPAPGGMDDFGGPPPAGGLGADPGGMPPADGLDGAPAGPPPDYASEAGSGTKHHGHHEPHVKDIMDQERRAVQGLADASVLRSTRRCARRPRR